MVVKAPTGKHIWNAVRDELMLNLYPLPFSTLAPTVYHIYLHPEDFVAVEPIASRIVAQIEKALTTEVASLNDGMARQARRVLARLLKRDELPPIEVPTSGWEIHIQADRNGEIARGQLGIVSTLANGLFVRRAVIPNFDAEREVGPHAGSPSFAAARDFDRVTRLPLSPYFRRPAASMAIMASMMPLVGMFWIAVLPLKSGEIRSAQVVTSRPTRSGRMPSVSAL